MHGAPVRKMEYRSPVAFPPDHEEIKQIMKNRILGKLVVACALLASVTFLGSEKPAAASNVCPGQVCAEHEVCRDYCTQLGAADGACNTRAKCCICLG